MNTEERTYEEAVEIAVKWWSEKSFETPLNQNNGDDSPNGGMIFALMNMNSASSQIDVTPDKKEKFEEKLTELLLSKKGMGRRENTLDVDYHPNDILSESCNFAGIDSSCLPCKTFTYIDEDNSVHGRYQYGGNWFKL